MNCDHGHRDICACGATHTYCAKCGANLSQFEANDGPQTWDAAVDRCLAELRQVMLDRQAKYGPENIRQQGLYGVLTRGAADKTARIMHALNGRIVNGQIILDPIGLGADETFEDSLVADETFEDALIDAANYFGVIARMVLRGWWDLPRAEP